MNGGLSPEDIGELWIEFKKDLTNQELRNRLVELYLPLVKYNGERIWARLPEGVELDDLISAGIFGLMDAIDTFDLTRGVKFETYCVPRIRGAMLDELRTMDWVPRLVRSKASKLNEAMKSLEARLGRQPNESELAEELQISVSELEKMILDANAVNLISLNKKWHETDSYKDVREIDILEDKKGEDPTRRIQKNDLMRLVTKGLNRNERRIYILHYDEELTMKEIGATLDLSESRVIEIHNSMVQRLGKQLNTAARRECVWKLRSAVASITSMTETDYQEWGLYVAAINEGVSDLARAIPPKTFPCLSLQELPNSNRRELIITSTIPGLLYNGFLPYPSKLGFTDLSRSYPATTLDGVEEPFELLLYWFHDLMCGRDLPASLLEIVCEDAFLTSRVRDSLRMLREAYDAGSLTDETLARAVSGHSTLLAKVLASCHLCLSQRAIGRIHEEAVAKGLGAFEVVTAVTMQAVAFCNMLMERERAMPTAVREQLDQIDRLTEQS